MLEEPSKPAIPSLPLEAILVDVAHNLVLAQQALDSASLDSEMRIREAGLDKFGLAAHWYAIPELTFDLRLAFEIGKHGDLQTHMANAEYQSQYAFDLKGSSLLHTRIATVPSTQTPGLNLHDKRFALQRVGQLKNVLQAYGRCQAPHFAIRYMPSAQGYSGGIWQVFLLDVQQAGQSLLRALVCINDISGEILRVWTDQESEPTSVNGVAFTPEQVEGALNLVNSANAQTLDETLGLLPNAVASILRNRPIGSLRKLGSLNFVGPRSLQKIRDFLSATVEGMVFNWQQVIALLKFVNAADQETLLALGLLQPAVDSLLAGRPFKTLVNVSEADHIGSVSLGILLAHVSDPGSASKASSVE